MEDLTIRVADFIGSLNAFKAEHKPSWPTAQVFNALLAAAQEQLPDDPVLKSVSSVGQDEIGRPTADAGTMRAVMTQVSSALGDTGPASFVG